MKQRLVFLVLVFVLVLSQASNAWPGSSMAGPGSATRQVADGPAAIALRQSNVKAGPTAIAPSDDEIRRILQQRINVEKQGVGIVVGVIDSHGQRIVSYGSFEKGDQRPLNGDTLFEIGSITKVMTSLLAAEMARRGEVKLDDPIQKYLPDSAKIPQRGGKQITLIDLATHTSGLPRMPDNFRPAVPDNPYADYTTDLLYSFLSSYELKRDIGIKYLYSNLGFALLGQGLAHHAGMDYEKLVVSRIFDPLSMKSTRITLTDEMKQRFTPGHSADLVTAHEWNLPAFAGAGALRSSANDLLTFLAAMMGYTNNPLADALKATLSIKRPNGPFYDTGLGWNIDTRGGPDSMIISKDGATGGYQTFIAYSPKTRVGVVALANSVSGQGMNDIGEHLLDARYPLWVPESFPSNEPTLEAGTLDQYVGQYEITPAFIITVMHDGSQLFVQGTNQPRITVFPEKDHEFSAKVVKATVTFEPDANGPAKALVLHQGGLDQRGPRIDPAKAKQLEDRIAQHVKEQKPFPTSEALIRAEIDEFQHKQVTYDRMTPTLAAIARPQESHAIALFADLGALQSITFKRVGPGGADIYEVKFEKRTLEWRLIIGDDGKIATQFMHAEP